MTDRMNEIQERANLMRDKPCGIKANLYVADVDWFFAQIESLTAQLAQKEKELSNARNELCLKCGRYAEAHNGACDGCKWREK